MQPGNAQDVYSFRPGETAWTCLIASKQVNVLVPLQMLPEVLDQLHDEVVRRVKPLEIREWIPCLPDTEHEWDRLAIVDQGGCLHLHNSGGKHPGASSAPWLVDINELIAKKTGRSAIIYSHRGTRESRQAAKFHYLFTDQGLFKYDLATAAVTAIALPDRAAPGAVVMLSDGERSQEFVRFGLLPADGGATYRLNLKAGSVEPEGCINESMPPVYWQSRSEEQNRAAVAEALQAAGQGWPLKRAAETRPAN
jgi:hypothetical protein